MLTPVEIVAAFSGGFSVLAHNYLQCSSTQLLQAALTLTSLGAILKVAADVVASGRMRATLEPINLVHEPTLRDALTRALALASMRKLPRCYWAPATGPHLATLGFLRPVLVISRVVAAKLDDEELEAALAHELLHARRRDALRVSLASVLCALMVLSATFAMTLYLAFFAGAFSMTPATAAAAVVAGLSLGWVVGRMLKARLALAAEYACDRGAAAGRGGPAAVASAMVKVARYETVATHRLAATSPFTIKSAFARRMRRLLVMARGTLPRRFPGRIVAAALAGVSSVWMLADGAWGGDTCATCTLVTEKVERWSSSE